MEMSVKVEVLTDLQKASAERRMASRQLTKMKAPQKLIHFELFRMDPCSALAPYAGR